MKESKFPRYQDYVVKNGKLVGEFEQMYQDFDDPWQQTKIGLSTKRAVILHLISMCDQQRVIELGSGLGYLTNQIRNLGLEVLGIDISRTAVEKAKQQFSNCNFP